MKVKLQINMPAKFMWVKIYYDILNCSLLHHVLNNIRTYEILELLKSQFTGPE